MHYFHINFIALHLWTSIEATALASAALPFRRGICRQKWHTCRVTCTSVLINTADAVLLPAIYRLTCETATGFGKRPGSRNSRSAFTRLVIPRIVSLQSPMHVNGHGVYERNGMWNKAPHGVFSLFRQCAGASNAMWSPHPAVCTQLCATCTGMCSARCSRLKFPAEICRSFWPEHRRIEPRSSCHVHHRCFCWHYIKNSAESCHS